ncbi:MAG TPA: SpoIIE family protein phosphatase [Candidatus Limnocylindrales bacterium]
MRRVADERAPAAARALVRSTLEGTHLSDLIDEALLLTTELATNVVVHAGGNVELEVITDRDGVIVTVEDERPGTISVPAVQEMHSDGGFGLLLVQHFCTRWGISHSNGGKAVWFRLDLPGKQTAHGVTPGAGLAAVEALLEIEPPASGDNVADEFAALLLDCLGLRVSAAGAVISVSRGIDGPSREVARFGADPAVASDALRIPLPVGWPWSGELVLAVTDAKRVRPLAALVAQRVGLMLESERLREAELRRQTWLTFLAEASELLAQSLDPQLTVALIPRLVVPSLGSWCAVYIIDLAGETRLASAAHADEEMLPSLTSAPPEGFTVPLVARGQRIGTLAVGWHGDQRHDAEERAVIQDLARRAALAIDNARTHHERRRIAHALQQSLLPPKLPTIEGVELGAEYVPIGDDVEVGGDFYDLVQIDDDRWLVAIGDVSGKGAQAANVTGSMRELLRVLVRDGRPLVSILDTLNSILYERGGQYCTLALAIVHRDGDGVLRLALNLAGHDQPLLIRTDGSVVPVGECGTAVGLFEALESPTSEVVVHSGETLVFFTDGVTERRHGNNFFGSERLSGSLSELAGHTADVVAARVRKTVLDFSPEPPRDDIAILAVRNSS